MNLTADFFPTRQPNASCFIFFADPHFLKTILASRTSGTFGFARHTSLPFAKPKEPLFAIQPRTVLSILKLSLPTEKQLIIKGQLL